MNVSMSDADKKAFMLIDPFNSLIIFLFSLTRSPVLDPLLAGVFLQMLSRFCEFRNFA